MLKLNNYLILIIFSILFLSLGFTAPVIESITPLNTYYTDSNEVVLRVEFSGFDTSGYHNFTFEGVNFNLKSCINFGCEVSNKTLKPTTPDGWIDFTFENTNKDREPGNVNFEFKIKESKTDCEYGDLDCSASDTYSLNLKDGTPSFRMLVLGEMSGESDVFNNKETVTLKLKGTFDGKNHFDNTDDGSDKLECKVYLDNNELPNLKKQVNDTDTEIELGQLPLEINKQYNLKVSCGNKEEYSFIKRIDKDPVINVNLTPKTIKPNSNVKCIPDITDVDTEIKEYFNPTYSWFKNASNTNITASEFDCIKNGCKAGDTLSCRVIYKLKDKEFKKEESVKIDSLFSNVAISSPLKAQIGEELSLQANFNYEGSNKLAFTWSFGDGKTSNSQNPKKVYDKKGRYSITLTITDNKGSTATVSHNIEIVDADILINVKSPLVNQEFNKGDKIKVLANITDNTGTPINDANVTAELVSNEKSFPKVILKNTNNNAYEGELEIDYLANELSEIKFITEYKKKGLHIKATKPIPIVLISTNLIDPKIELVTKFPESENSISIGNTIEYVNICFRLPNNKFDDAFSNTKLILEASETLEYNLEEIENKCYIVNTNYRVKSLDYDTKITFKFKDAKDDFGNYVKLSKKVEYEVIEGEDVLDIVLVEPKINKTNYGQRIFVSYKYVLKEGFIESKLKDLKAWIEYKGKTYELEDFKTSFMPENEPKVNFKLVVSGLYDERLFEKEITKSLDMTNELKIELISPNESGVIKTSGKVILAIKYQNDFLYDANSITMFYDDKNIIFNRINSGSNKGYFVSDYDDVSILKSTILNFKGSDNYGNNFLVNKEIPTMSWMLPLFVYFIILGVIIVLIVLTIAISSISTKQKAFAKELKGKSYEQLKDDLEVEKRILGDLKRKYFKQEINESEFKMKKTEVESKISVLESKLANEDQKERRDLEKSKEYFNQNQDQKQKLETKLGFENDIYDKYRHDIETLSYKLKPFRDKYTAEEMRIAIKQSKDLPENVIDKIIEKVYN